MADPTRGTISELADAVNLSAIASASTIAGVNLHQWVFTGLCHSAYLSATAKTGRVSAGFGINDDAAMGNSMEVSMSVRSKVKAIAVFSVLGAATLSAAAHAEDWHAREVQLLGLHDLCNKGDRKACIQFGMILGESKERHADWRRSHADWWWWEH